MEKYILIPALILLVVYLIVFPLSKKRPVLIKEVFSTVFALVLVSVVASFVNPALYVVGLALAGVGYVSKVWVIYGVSRPSLMSALERATLATRSTGTQLKRVYLINDASHVRIISLGKYCHVTTFRIRRGSRKARLTKDIFKKFIQNYFLGN